MLYAALWRIIKKKKYIHPLPSYTNQIIFTNKPSQGLRVPQVLRKYIPGQPEFIPYVKELAKDSTSAKAKAGVSLASGPTAKHSTGGGGNVAGVAGTAKAKVEEAVNAVADKLK